MKLAGRNSPAEKARIVEAARLFFVKRKTQTEIATEMQVEQSTVSRWLNTARDQGLITLHVEVRPDEELEERLRNALAPKGVKNVSVVPRSGDPKNLDNLADCGALAILDAIAASPKKNIDLTLACGSTLMATIFALTEIVRTQKSKREVLAEKESINLYPATLWGEYSYTHKLQAIYPHILVTLAYVHLSRFVNNINAYAPILPVGFFDMGSNERGEFLQNPEIKQLLTSAKEADIIVAGIGITGDERFEHIHAAIHKDDVRLPHDTPEICYQPLKRDGELADRAYTAVVGLSLKELKQAAQDESRTVIGISGGSDKRAAVVRVLSLPEPFFNWVITDDMIGEELLAAVG